MSKSKTVTPPADEPKHPFQPLTRRVLVLPDQAPEATPTGIILPDGPTREQQKPKSGVVVSLATDVTEVKVGTQIFFSGWAGTELTIGNVRHVCVEIKDALGFLQV